MRVWLTCFGVLFVGAELFQWVVQLDTWHFSGAWLILGGMGLAAASNAAHLPYLRAADPSESESALNKAGRKDGATAEVDRAADQDRAKQTPTSALRAEQASISFKVRSPRP